MKDWHEEWWQQLTKAATEVENFWVEVGEATELAVEEASENLSLLFEQFQADVEGELDNLMQNLVDVIISTSEEIDATIIDDWEDFSDDNFTNTSYHQPSAHSHPACINCVHYHGQVYNGNLLVCAMHPYGSEDNDCPDWESEN